MELLEKQIRTILTWAIVLSILMPIGIFMIIFGFVKEIMPLGFAGIALPVASFYGAPLLYIKAYQLKYYKRLNIEIKHDKIFSVKMLSELNNKKPYIVANDIKTMIQKGYLSDVIILDNERLLDRSNMSDQEYHILEAQRAGELHFIKCPSCNAKFEIYNDVDKCPYCGTKISKPTNNIEQ